MNINGLEHLEYIKKLISKENDDVPVSVKAGVLRSFIEEIETLQNDKLNREMEDSNKFDDFARRLANLQKWVKEVLEEEIVCICNEEGTGDNLDCLYCQGASLLTDDRDSSWRRLMSLLDENWPEDIFPTTYRIHEPNRDMGACIVSLIRWIDKLKKLK